MIINVRRQNDRLLRHGIGGHNMEIIDKIEKALLDNEADLAHRTALKMPLYDCAGDYVRGWVAALQWVKEEMEGGE